MSFANSVNILGTTYNIAEVSDDKNKGLAGATDFYTKTIEIADMQGINSDALITDDIESFRKAVLRHEIVHAFLYESGMDMQSGECESWAKNETVVDWFALQGQKIYSAWQEVGCIG